MTAAQRPKLKGVRPKHVRNLRAVIREHLREEGKTIRDLSEMLGLKFQSARRLMTPPERNFPPDYVERIIIGLQLDEFDANELRILGAIEAGWNLNLKLQVV